jgi:excisionase family DNA binding protein
MEKQIKQFLNIKEVAEKLGVSPSTIRMWGKKGIIKTVRIYSRVNRRFLLSEIEKF